MRERPSYEERAAAIGSRRRRGGPKWDARNRPPWWPEGEAWPPEGDAWRAMRRRFLIRFFVVFVLVLGLAVVVPVVFVWHALVDLGIHPAFAGLGALLGPALVAVVVVRVVGLRSLALPLGDLIEASARLEAGDYSVRVRERGHGPPELRSLLRAFNSMASRLETEEQRRRSLLADVSHELRTPLAVLQGELEAMLDGVHPTDDEHLGATLEETRVLTRLVEDLRTLALAESGGLALHREPADLAILADEVVTGFEGIAAASGARVELASDDVPLLDVDPVRIREVLTNLVSNALRYAPKGSAVRVAVHARPDTIEVAVTDGGPGIPPELLPRLFDRFAKGPESRGSGLGLAIARYLVEAHGGRIEAVQPPEGGTTIRFTLPAPAEPTTRPADAAALPGFEPH